MTRTLSPEELEEVRLTELQQQVKAADRQRTAQQAGDGMVKLYHPTKDGLQYGPGTAQQDGTESDRLIVFGQLEPGVAIVRADHPLLPGLLRAYPGIKVMEPGEVLGRTYACETCDREFATKRGLSNHRKDEHPAPPAPTRKQADASGR